MSDYVIRFLLVIWSSNEITFYWTKPIWSSNEITFYWTKPIWSSNEITFYWTKPIWSSNEITFYWTKPIWSRNEITLYRTKLICIATCPEDLGNYCNTYNRHSTIVHIFLILDKKFTSLIWFFSPWSEWSILLWLLKVN